MPKASKSTENVFETYFKHCEMKIDMTEILNFVEFLDRDELGVRIFQMSLQICVEVVNSQSNNKYSLKFMRLNHSGSQGLHSNQYVKKKSTFNEVLPWSMLYRQNPDGLFELTISGHAQGPLFVIIQYESDGHDKKAIEFGQVFRKYCQGIDLQLTWNDSKTTTFFEKNGTYAIRSNLAHLLLDTGLKEPLVNWLYNFTRSHIKTILMIMNDILNPQQSHLSAEKSKSNIIMDHIFLIGAFDVHVNRQLTLNSSQLLDRLPKIKTYNDSKTYLKNSVQENADLAINQPLPKNFVYGHTLPFPLLTKKDNSCPQWNNVKFDVKTEKRILFVDNLEIQVISFERGRIEKKKCHGLFNSELIRSFMQKKDLSAFTENVAYFEKWWNTKGNLIHSDTAYDSIITHVNLFSVMELIFLEIFYNEPTTGFLTHVSQRGLSWKYHGVDIKKELRDVTNRTDGLNGLKMALRNEPHKYRHRHAFVVGQMFNNSTSFLSCLIGSLHKTLPPLDPSIELYLQKFNIPNATLFCRMLRIPNILALREMARRTIDAKIGEQYERLLQTMPLGTQTELEYLFSKLRQETDVALHPDYYLNINFESSKNFDEILFVILLGRRLGISTADVLKNYLSQKDRLQSLSSQSSYVDEYLMTKKLPKNNLHTLFSVFE